MPDQDQKPEVSEADYSRISVKELLTELYSRGASWVATIQDVEQIAAQLAARTPAPPRAEMRGWTSLSPKRNGSKFGMGKTFGAQTENNFMNTTPTPNVPPGYELLTAQIAKLKPEGMKWKHQEMEPEVWLDWKPNWTDVTVYLESGHLFSAPLGTTALLTTPAPEVGRCDCKTQPIPAKFGGSHLTSCPQHPRNAMILVLPQLLAGLKEKPEGLKSCIVGEKEWTDATDTYWSLPGCQENYFTGQVAYAIPRWVLDQIESQKGGDEICTATVASNAAPANVPSVPVAAIQLVIKDCLDAAKIRESVKLDSDYARALKSVAIQLSALIAMPVAWSGPTDGATLEEVTRPSPEQVIEWLGETFHTVEKGNHGSWFQIFQNAMIGNPSPAPVPSPEASGTPTEQCPASQAHLESKDSALAAWTAAKEVRT